MANYAFKPTAEQALRSIQSAARRRLNAALGIMTLRTDKSVFTSVSEVESLWRANAGKYEMWWDKEIRVVCSVNMVGAELTLSQITQLRRTYPFYQDLKVKDVLEEIRGASEILIGDFYAPTSERYWGPWEKVGLRVDKVQYEQRYYWLEDCGVMSCAAASDLAEIEKAQELARELGYKLRKARF